MISLKRLGVLAIAAVLGGACLFPSAPAFAQSVQCDESGTDEQRIACLQARVDALEAELARARGELAAATPGEEPLAPVIEDPTANFGAEQLEDAAPVAAAAAEPARQGRRWLRMPRVNIPFLGRDDEDEGGSEPTAVAAAEPAATGPASAAITGPEAFGSEQVAERMETRDLNMRDEEDEVLRAQIIDFQTLHRGRLVLALDNGQMWRQMDVDSRQVRLEEGETYPVEIRRSGFGGYRMKVADNNRIMTVERLR